MRAPGFWWSRRPTPAALALWPLAAIYGAITGRRAAREGERAPVPVICVGNFVAGGAGKTPVALALAERLAARGWRPVFLSRGYGGSLAGPVVVDPSAHSPAQVGDEPLLLARQAPTVVSRDRPAGARLAATLGDVVVMDDGLQNPSLAKDLAIAVVDGGTGVGNGLCLPAGPLRAPLAAQWPLAGAVVVIGEGEAGEEIAAEAMRRSKPVLRASVEPDPGAAALLDGRRVLAFAGIGRPEKFFASLAGARAITAETRAFPDHHPYSAAEVEALLARASAEGLVPVTTAKDMVRVRAALPARAADIRELPVRLRLREPGGLDALLEGISRDR